MTSILFVCTGNICRSSGAEALLRHKTNALDVQIESAGTHGYHVGEPPDLRGVKVAKNRHISMEGMTARKVDISDFDKFDHIIAMDRGHMQTLENIKPKTCHAHLSMFMTYCDDLNFEDVPDPYYDDEKAFEQMYDILEKGIEGIIKKLL